MFERLVRQAAKRALRTPTPPRYSISDPSNNFAHVTLSPLDGQTPDAIITGIQKEGMSGIFWNGDRFDEAGSIPNSQISQMNFTLERVYGRFRTTYDSPLEYLVKDSLGYSRLLPLYDWALQKRYNLGFRQRRARIDLLSELVELEVSWRTVHAFQINTNGRSAIDLFSTVYGSRVWGRSDHDELLQRFVFALDSFVASGELSKNNSRYQILPTALATIDRYAVEDARHHDSLSQNRRLTWLTVVLAIAAVAQAASAFLIP